MYNKTNNGKIKVIVPVDLRKRSVVGRVLC